MLVVDDNATNRRILDQILRQWQVVPTLAVGGEEALQLLAQAQGEGRPFDAALLDVNMPGMDGFALATEMRARASVKGPSILMLSSSDHADAMERCRALSLSAYLIKPITQRDLGASVPAAAPPRPGPASGLRVLLAEDNVVNQTLAVHLLRAAGHQVTVAATGVEAVDGYTHGVFDVICMDLQMPDMDGFEATAAIRRIEAGCGGHIPIIALTAHAMAGDRERCLDASMDGYVAKPIRRAELLAEIARVTGSVGAPAEPPPAAPAEAAGAPMSGATLRFQDDEAMLRELAEVFLEDHPARLAEIRAALAEGDASRLTRAAHTLKGSVGVLCEDGPFVSARELEMAARAGDLRGAAQIAATLEQQIDLLGRDLAARVVPAA